jgi:Peptidase A4 family
MTPKSRRARVVSGAALACCALMVCMASSAGAATTHGALLHVAKPHTSLHAAQSNNWFGYNQGTLEQGGKQFNSITGDWVVPTATQHTAGQAASSSTWIGIGGGCIDANCTVGDNTLIQTGTEQDVDASGKASYSAWYELIPAPGLTISNLAVSPGDHMSATIAEAVAGSNVWKITLKNVTKNQTFTTTVPYSSTHATAEWIQETPIVIGTGGTGLAALPNLTTNSFTGGKTNGAVAGLKSSEQIQLIDSNNRVIGAPSAPNATSDGFSLCSWASSC